MYALMYVCRDVHVNMRVFMCKRFCVRADVRVLTFLLMRMCAFECSR